MKILKTVTNLEWEKGITSSPILHTHQLLILFPGLLKHTTDMWANYNSSHWMLWVPTWGWTPKSVEGSIALLGNTSAHFSTVCRKSVMKHGPHLFTDQEQRKQQKGSIGLKGPRAAGTLGASAQTSQSMVFIILEANIQVSESQSGQEKLNTTQCHYVPINYPVLQCLCLPTPPTIESQGARAAFPTVGCQNNTHN